MSNYDRNYDEDWERRRQGEYDERQSGLEYGTERKSRASTYRGESQYYRYPGEYEYDERPGRGRSLNREESYGSVYGARPSSYNRYYERTYRPPYYGRDFDYEREDRRDYRGERGWWDRASDEVASWFGDKAAEQRRRSDELRQGTNRGRGPRGYKRSDERIREDINDRLTDHDYIDAYDVQVTVNEGQVTLSGFVTSRRDKRLAEDIAESVSGVTDVQNNLRVGQSNVSEDTNIAPTQSRAAGQQ